MKPYPKVTEKKKQPSLKSLDAKLWKIFSEFIRRRDALKFSGGDRVKCITCSHVDNWVYFDCGHFISRRHLATKFDEKNNHAQCKGCNGFGAGNQYGYGIAIDRIYGNGTASLLFHKSKQPVKWDKWTYEILIKEYSDKLKALK